MIALLHYHKAILLCSIRSNKKAIVCIKKYIVFCYAKGAVKHFFCMRTTSVHETSYYKTISLTCIDTMIENILAIVVCDIFLSAISIINMTIQVMPVTVKSITEFFRSRQADLWRLLDKFWKLDLLALLYLSIKIASAVYTEQISVISLRK